MKFERAERLKLFKQAINIDDWTGLKILDYGGNAGNLLKDGIETGEIKESDYTCLDVDEKVLVEEHKKYPDAKFISYNRKNPVYNWGGEDRIPLPFEDDSFDIACAYSVHSHCSYEDFVFDLNELKRVAKIVVTSVIDAEFITLLGYKRKSDYIEVHPLWSSPRLAMGYRYFIDEDTVEYSQDLIPARCDLLITQYNLDWLEEQHPEIRISPAHSNHHQPMVVVVNSIGISVD